MHACIIHAKDGKDCEIRATPGSVELDSLGPLCCKYARKHPRLSKQSPSEPPAIQIQILLAKSHDCGYYPAYSNIAPDEMLHASLDLCIHFLQHISNAYVALAPTRRLHVRVAGQEMRKAAAEGDLATVQQLVQDFAHVVNARDADQRTALHLAAGKGQLEVLGFLLEHGADPTVRDRFGYQPLDDARKNNHELCARLLDRAISRRTWQGQARIMMRRILMRDSLRFKPAWGEMITSSKFGSLAFDTEFGGGGQIIEYDPAFLSLLGWVTDLVGTVFRIPILHIQSFLLLLLAFTYCYLARVPGPGQPSPAFPGELHCEMCQLHSVAL
jgi:hypothetical protein